MIKAPAADVLVVGAGIFGLSCAYACLKHGLRVILAEAEAPGAGASGGIVGALSPHLPERWTPAKQFQLDALRAAPAFWAGVAADGGLDPGYGRPGRLMPLATETARAQAEARGAGASAFWGDIDRWTLLPSTESPGWLAPCAAPFGVVHETLSGRLPPRRALAALAAAVTARGGEIRTGWRAHTLAQNGVRFDGGEISAGAIILAAGVSTAHLAALPGRGVKGQAALLAATPPPDAPLIYADGIYVVPQPGGRVAVGSTSEDSWDDPTTPDAALEDVLARARALSPALAQAPVVERWAALRPRAARPDPMLGPLPGHAGVFVATGGFKIGFGLAPAVGETLAAMITGAPADLPPGYAVADHLAARQRRSADPS